MVWKKNLAVQAEKTIKNNSIEKVRFIEVNELKLTQVELFKFFYFVCVAANASELF